MALRGALTHRKTRRLAQLLNTDPCYALGIVESLWHVTGEQAHNGAIGRMSNADIAMEMFYSGDADRLIEALLTAVFLEAHPEHRLIVHDWHIHSDDATDNKLSRSGLLYANGAKPRMRRLSKTERAHAEAHYSSPCDSVRTDAHDCALPVPVPEPVPVPVPVPVIEETSSPIAPSSQSDSKQDRGPVIGTLPLNDGKNFELHQADADEWQETFQAVDVRQKLREIRQWLIDNPKRRKTKNGIRKFVGAWLAREQDRGGQFAPRITPFGGNANGIHQQSVSAARRRTDAGLATLIADHPNVFGRVSDGAPEGLDDSFVPESGSYPGDAKVLDFRLG